tara:strand:- start:6513 stop:7877 length:1365 start_codon:yes stop_codon:yes gene_type:complete
MSYKFQLGSAFASGSIVRRLGTGDNNQMVLQDDAGNIRLRLRATPGGAGKGSISGSGGIEMTTGSFSGLLYGSQLSASELRVNGLKGGGNRVVFTGTGGLLETEAGFTYTKGTDTFVAANVSASSTLYSAGAASFGKNKIVAAADGGLKIAHMDADWTNAGITVADLGTITTVDINGGTADNVVIGGATPAAASFTTLSASSTLKVGGTVQLDGVADATFAAADRVYFRDADGSGLVKSDTWSGLMDVAAGTAADTGLKNTAGVLSLDLCSLNAETIATGDKIAFCDVGDNGLHNETIDDFMAIGMPLLASASLAAGNDFVAFMDSSDSNKGKKVKWATFAAAIAGAGITATNGVLSSDASPTPNKLVHKETLTEGLNYATGSKSATVYLPQDADIGDTVRVKAAGLASGKVITIGRRGGSGTKIEDVVQDIGLTSQYGAVTFILAATGSWLIV